MCTSKVPCKYTDVGNQPEKEWHEHNGRLLPSGLNLRRLRPLQLPITGTPPGNKNLQGFPAVQRHDPAARMRREGLQSRWCSGVQQQGSG